MRPKKLADGLVMVGMALGLLATWVWWSGQLSAADHHDGPGATADHAADLSDLYVFHDDRSRRLTIIFTYAGKADPTDDPIYDPDVLYTVHIDNDLDQIADTEIHIRFGCDAEGKAGIQIPVFPGFGRVVEGQAGSSFSLFGTGGNGRVWSGRTDDPFFFDLIGLQESLETGRLAFERTRDAFEGKKAMAVALEVSLDLLQRPDDPRPLQVWVTSGRR